MYVNSLCTLEDGVRVKYPGIRVAVLMLTRRFLVEEVRVFAHVETNPCADIVIREIEDLFVVSSLNITGDIENLASPKTIKRVSAFTKFRLNIFLGELWGLSPVLVNFLRYLANGADLPVLSLVGDDVMFLTPAAFPTDGAFLQNSVASNPP